jgi:hypothetical protein
MRIVVCIFGWSHWLLPLNKTQCEDERHEKLEVKRNRSVEEIEHSALAEVLWAIKSTKCHSPDFLPDFHVEPTCESCVNKKQSPVLLPMLNILTA